MATSKVTTPRGLIVVTGGSGYIAGYCIAQLLNERSRARTTVRNLGAAEEVRASISKITANASAIEFKTADLNSDVGWADAVAGADYVLHVASPVPTVDPKSDDELVRPARDGTLRVLMLRLHGDGAERQGRGDGCEGGLRDRDLEPCDRYRSGPRRSPATAATLPRALPAQAVALDVGPGHREGE